MEEINKHVEQIFHIQPDLYESIVMDTSDRSQVPFSDDADFEMKLETSLEKWKKEKIRGVWIKIAIQHSSLVPVCVRLGFVFNHAQNDYVMMNQWLPKDRINRLPNYANQFLGCGGFVVNEQDQILTIQERFAVSRRWKLPGGLADQDEDISTAAVREVFEETGITCQFIGILCFRHMHQFRFGCSDFYFVSLLKPLSHEIKKCEEEIHDCCWMPLDEYMSQELTEMNRCAAKAYLKHKQAGTALIAAETFRNGDVFYTPNLS